MASSYEILISHKIPPAGPSGHSGLYEAVTAALPEATVTVASDSDSMREKISEADVLLASELSAEMLDAASSLKWVQSLYAGVGGFPVEQLEERGIVLTSGAGIHAQAVAETVLGYLLIFERGFLQGLENQRQQTWKRYEVSELGEKTVGIVGVGELGSRIAELCTALGTTVIGTKRNPEEGVDDVDEIYAHDEVHRLASRSDYVVLTCPLTDETAGLFGEAEFVSMKNSGILVNVARGPVVDHSALVEALQKGEITGAALDVTDPEPLPADSPLWTLPEVIITPHIAGGTDQYWNRGAALLATNYDAFVDGRRDEMQNRVV